MEELIINKTNPTPGINFVKFVIYLSGKFP